MGRGVIVLGLETSVQPGSIALINREGRTVECPLPDTGSTASVLFPEIARLLADQGCDMADVDVLAVSQGPGSFTGLRIAITVAKVWAYARGTKVVAITTPEILAAQVPVRRPELWVLLDAQRRELYAQAFSAQPGGWQVQGPCRVCTIPEWLTSIHPPCQVVGPGLRRVFSAVPSLPAAVEAEAEELWTPHAGTLVQLTVPRSQQCRFDNPWTLLPLYVRPSGAEEKRMET